MRVVSEYLVNYLQRVNTTLYMNLNCILYLPQKYRMYQQNCTKTYNVTKNAKS